MRFLLVLLFLMPEYIGDIEIPEPPSGADFPLGSDYGHTVSRDYTVAVHLFGSANRKIEQRYLLGAGARIFTFQRERMSKTQRDALRDHWEANKGAYQQFTYNAPSTDQATTAAYTVRYGNDPLLWQVQGPKSFGCRVVLKEVPSPGSAPSYTVTATVTRFPAGGLAASLLGQEQLLVPLIKIQPKESGYAAIYLSDRRCTVGGQLYQPRLTDWDGISQTVGSASDDAGFSFGNADLVFTQLANDVDLMRASIEFSLLHLAALDGSGTNTKIDLWKGEIVSWQDDEGSTDFTVRASDGIYELRLPYPVRKVSRTCWKDLGNGPCTWTSGGQGRDLVHFPSASTTECDKGYETPNGCLAHNNAVQFGGIVAEPQGVLIKDNGTGTWGLGRNRITSTSIVNDSAYEKPIREVYTDSDMPVGCDIIAGRDEFDFYEALGIVGEGPLTFATPGPLKYHTLDGQPHHGHPGSLGLRTIAGTDPTGSTDFLSLDQSGNQAGGDFRKVYSGNSTYKNNFSAGVAALVIRRTDEKGLQLTRPTDHQMTAIVSGGIQGYVWTGEGTRSLQTLTNPIWIAVNMLLRARGLQFASAATCEAYFDVTAAIAAANICDATVSKIAGLSGTETQFKFRGVIQEEKPLRDWIDEVLTNCLGYYTFAFGKMKFGIRNNSSVVEAFTVGNTLVDSLRLAPVQSGVNDLTGVFADEAYDYQANSVNVYAIDHKKLVGGAASPLSLKQTLNLAGTSNASQAARIVSTRLKEEMGGATLAEWRKARNLQVRTTILALNVEPGMACSMTHERMPDGAGEFRVLGWRLNRDMSIDIEGKTTTDAMYDLAQGPKPADVLPAAVPIEQVQYPRRPGWMAAANRGSASDPIQGFQEFSIGVAEHYETGADGNVQAQILINGLAPRNRFLDVPPPIIRGLTSSTASGTIPAGNWWVCLAPYKGSQAGPPSNILAATLSAAGKLTIAEITWPQPPSGTWDGYYWMLGDSEQSMCQNQIAGSSLPSSVEIDFERRFSGALQPNISKVRAKVKLCPWPGIVRGAVSNVTSTTIVVDGFAGGGDAFTGRRVSIISDDSDGRPGVWNFSCSSYDQATGTFTVTQNPVTAGVESGDMLVVLTSPSSVTSTGYSDTAYNFTTDELVGYVARVLYGKGRGQARTITANSATAITVELAWDTNPDSTSVIVIEEAGWGYSAESAEIENLSGLSIAIEVPIDNLPGAVVLVAGFGVDRFGIEAPESATPMRLLYLKGEPFQVTVDTGTYTATANDRTILVDATTDQDIDLAAAASTRGNRIVVKRIAGSGVITLNGDIDGSASLVVDDSVILESDGTEYRSLVAASGGGGSGAIVPHAVNVTADVTISYAAAAANTVLLLVVKMDATGGWVVDLDTGDFGEQPVFDNAANAVNPSMWYSDGTKWRRLTEIWQH